MTPRLFGKLLTFLVSLGNSLLPTYKTTLSVNSNLFKSDLNYDKEQVGVVRERWVIWSVSIDQILKVWQIGFPPRAQPKTFKEEKASSA